MSDITNVKTRQEAIEIARRYAMTDSSRTRPKRHLLLGELVMFIRELYPDIAEEKTAGNSAPPSGD